MNTINNAVAVADPSIVKIGDRKKLQGTYHKYIVNEIGEYTCNYCEKTSKNQSTISEHISRLHASEAGRIVKPFDCPTCEKRFNSASIRDQHIQNNHFNVRDSCVMPGCNYKGKSGSALCAHYARKHMDIDELITTVDCEISACNHCHKHLNKSAILYHLARCSPTSPYCKDIQVSMRATSNLGVDLSNAKPADKISSPSVSEKLEKKALVQADPFIKKAKKERTVKKPRKRLLIIFEEIEEEEDELLKEKALYKKMKSDYNVKKIEYDSAEIKDKDLLQEASILKKMIEKSKEKIRILKKK